MRIATPRDRARRRSCAALACLLLLFCASPSAAVDSGQKAPLFVAPALEGGGKISLDAYRGKVVYLDFWASWCGPCLTALPLLEELRQEFPADRFQVIGVNVDRDPAQARKFLDRVSVGYPSVVDPDGRIPESFGVETMPTSYVIDARGVVRHVHRGFRRGDVDALRTLIGSLLKSAR